MKSHKKLTRNNNHNSEKFVRNIGPQEKYNSISVFDTYKDFNNNIDSITNPADHSKSERRKSKAVRMKKTIDAIHSAASNNSNKNIKSVGKIYKLSVKDSISNDKNVDNASAKKEAVKVIHSERQQNPFHCQKNSANPINLLAKSNVSTINTDNKKIIGKKISKLQNMPNLNKWCLKSLQNSHQKTKTIEIISNSTMNEAKDSSKTLTKNDSKKYRTFDKNSFSAYPPHISPKSCFNNTVAVAFTKPKEEEKIDVQGNLENEKHASESGSKLLKKTSLTVKPVAENEKTEVKYVKNSKASEKNLLESKKKKRPSTEIQEKLTFFTKKNIPKNEIRRCSPVNSNTRSKSGKSKNEKSSEKLKYPFYIKNLNLINNKLMNKEKCYINVDSLKEMVKNHTMPNKNNKNILNIKSSNTLINSNQQTTAIQINNNFVTPKSTTGFNNFQKATINNNNKKNSNMNAKNSSMSKNIEKDNTSKSNHNLKQTCDKDTIQKMMLNLKDCNTFHDFKEKKNKEQVESRKGNETSLNDPNRIERTNSIVTIQSPVKTVLKGRNNFMDQKDRFDKEKIKLSARLGRENIMKKRENEDTKYSAREIRHNHSSEINKTLTIKKEFDKFDIKKQKKLKNEIKAETLPTNFSDLNSFNLNNTESEIQEEVESAKNIDVDIVQGDSFLVCNDECIENLSTKKDQQSPNPFCDQDELHSFCVEDLKSYSWEENVKANEVINQERVQGREPLEDANAEKDDDEKTCWATLEYMLKDEELYFIDKNAMEKHQKEVKMKMRAILIDWISEVCSDYLFTRDTFYTAIKFIDLFQSKHGNIAKNEFQLVGICAIFMSMKLQEVIIIPSSEFLRLANDIYNTKQLKEMEQNMIDRLNWNLNPITLNHWLSYITVKWDEFTLNENIEKILVVPDTVDYTYRKRNIKSYINYREISQYIDSCLMVPEHLNYNGGLQIASFVYLHIAIKLEIFLISDVYNYFHGSSLYIVDENLIFNWVFGNFLQDYLKVGLDELLPFAQFASLFFSLPLEVQTPNQQNFHDYIDRSYEEMLSYMIYNPNCLQFICDRNF